jgi:hypothetical protein
LSAGQTQRAGDRSGVRDAVCQLPAGACQRRVTHSGPARSASPSASTPLRASTSV